MGFKLVEVRCPQLAVGGEPLVELRERLWPDPIQAALCIRPHLDQTGILENAQVLRDGGLAQAKAVDEFAHRPFAIAQVLEDRKSPRLRENLEGNKLAHRKNYY